jgi:hypothetical protein
MFGSLGASCAIEWKRREGGRSSTVVPRQKSLVRRVGNSGARRIECD